MLSNFLKRPKLQFIKSPEWEIVEEYDFNIESINNTIGYNQSGCIQYCPFWDNPDNENYPIVLKSWAQDIKHLLPIIEKCQMVDTFDHTKNRQSHGFWWLYNNYLETFSYKKDAERLNLDWAYIKVDVQELKDALIPIYENNSHEQSTNYSWFSQLDNQIQKRYKSRAFIRTAKKSTKNDTGIRPVKSAQDALNLLGSSKEVISWLSETLAIETYLIVLAWNDDITTQNEFRVIVHNKKIKTICQQAWFIDVGLDSNKMKIISKHIAEYVKNIIPILNYPDVVLDVWIDHNNQVNFIEANPGGRWACSNSGLARWTDEKIWLDDNIIHIRYFYDESKRTYYDDVD